MWLDKVKETFSIMTNVKVKKDWSTLEKDDKLFLMIPYTEDGIIKYAVLSENLESMIAITLPNIALLCLFILFRFTGVRNKSH